jgi:hypothetical protein
MSRLDLITDWSSDDSDDDDYYWQYFLSVPPLKPRGGSSFGKAPKIDRGRQEAGERPLRDYFGDNPVYTDCLCFSKLFWISDHP